MADQEQDKDVSRRYRELGRDEPPPALDAKIRAEARSALETHAAPLVPPTGRRRWYFPVAAAAVIMLAVAVTTQLEREQPADVVATAPELKKEAALQEKQKVEEQKPRPFAQAPKDQATAEPSSGARSRGEFSRDNRARQERPAAAPAAPPPAAAPQVEAERKLRADALGSVAARAKIAEETPEAWLERIAKLRAEGRHEEADKALAEFRKRYPDYKIPPATLEKVEKKKER